ncbi:endonuclease-reverse transcriptase [Apostichopus japonicus]|uniref:Endonuclease-reverse transcriptase n=1 Tax=Stichopus japonicus TaxID=307972 RepID=A0A2G8JE23_STIJA|nr:endonuclease-reverse transcriptase [Apostichopus japonicus]
MKVKRPQLETECGDSDWFTIGQGVRQGCILSPYLFNIYAEYIMRLALDDFVGQVSIGGRQINNLRYADDTTLLARTAAELQDLIERVKQSSEEYGLYLNVKKTKVMICGGKNDHHIQADGEDVEVVNTFNFLGSLIVDGGGCSQEIRRRLAMARSSAINLTDIWKDRGISRNTKIHIMNALVFPIATYGSETWALGAVDRKKIHAFEMWCWRRMLRISWKERKSNDFVKNQIGAKVTLCQKIDKNKLQYFGHISRREGDNLEKIITQGHVEGHRKRGRPKVRWADGIKEITGMNICAAHRFAQDRSGWNVIINRVTKGQS